MSFTDKIAKNFNQSKTEGLEDLNIAINREKNKLLSIQDEIKNVNNIISTKNKEVDILNKSIQDLESLFLSNKENYEKDIKSLEDTKNNLLNEIDFNRKSLNLIKQEVDVIKNNNSSLLQENNNLESEMELIKIKIDEKKEYLDTLIKEKTGDVEILKSQADKLSLQNSNATYSIAILTKKIEHLCEIETVLNNTILDLRINIENTKEELEKENLKTLDLIDKNEALKNKFLELEVEKDIKEKELRVIEDRILLLHKREKNIIDKEVYIKEYYNRAGIQFN